MTFRPQTTVVVEVAGQHDEHILRFDVLDKINDCMVDEKYLGCKNRVLDLPCLSIAGR